MREPTRYYDLGPLHQLLLRACPEDKDGRRSIMVLAPMIGVSPQNIYRWIAANRIPPKRVIPLLQLSEGRISKAEILQFVL